MLTSVIVPIRPTYEAHNSCSLHEKDFISFHVQNQFSAESTGDVSTPGRKHILEKVFAKAFDGLSFTGRYCNTLWGSVAACERRKCHGMSYYFLHVHLPV